MSCESSQCSGKKCAIVSVWGGVERRSDRRQKREGRLRWWETEEEAKTERVDMSCDFFKCHVFVFPGFVCLGASCCRWVTRLFGRINVNGSSQGFLPQFLSLGFLGAWHEFYLLLWWSANAQIQSHTAACTVFRLASLLPAKLQEKDCGFSRLYWRELFER